MGWPSLSDVSNAWSSVRNTVSNGADAVSNTVSSTVTSVRSTVTSTVTSVRETASAATSRVSDFAASARDRAVDLARDGADLGRRGVEAVRNFDVREAAATARAGIASGTEAARDGISTATSWTSERVGEGADWARDHVPGGDNIASNAVRSVISGAESTTRFQLGVTGGVAREVVGTAGALGQLTVTAAEMQASPQASREYGEKIAGAIGDGARATGGYLQSVANDPTRLAGDAKGAWDATSGFVGDTASRYGQAIREGRTEEIGMDVGTVATYVVPIGGGPARGALTAAVRTGAEVTVRGTVEVAARTAVREGGEAVVREGVEAGARTTTELATVSREIGQEVARVDGQRVVAGAAAEEAGSIRRINPGYPAPQRTQNCVECVIATERRFAGDLTAVANPTSGPLPISKITDVLGGTFQPVSGPAEIGSILSRSGDGARGIVYGADNARGFGHVWNVRIDNGVVRFLDSQPGGKAGLGVGNFDHFTDFQFLLTHSGK